MRQSQSSPGAAQGISNDVLASLVEFSDDAIIGTTLEGIIVSWNKAAENFYGYAANEMLGRSISLLIPPHRPDELPSILARLKRGEALKRYETVRLNKNGECIDISLTISPIKNAAGKTVAASVIARDISERKRAEAALQRQEAEFRAVFEHAGIGIALVGANGELVRCNPALQQMLGYTEDELCRLNFKDFTHPGDLERAVSLFLQLMEGKLDRYQIEKCYIRKDGSVIWGRLTASIVRTRDGEAKYCVGMIEDITAQRKLEDQFRQAQKMQAVGRLAGGVAHDFNNHLNVIMGYASLLERDASLEKVRENAGEIFKAAERASSLTRQLLAFSRKQVLRQHVVDLNEAVAGTSTMLRRLIGEDIELCIQLADDLLCIRTGTGQVEQVIMNLALNARDAMPRGGQLTIATSKVELSHDEARHLGLCAGTYSVLRVSDNGHGIDAETQAHMFEPFFTTKEPGKGTGLGLATVHGIVAQSGGNISVDSTANVGTTFIIYLPFAQKQAEDVVRTPPVVFKAAARASETILLVEDEVSLRTLTNQLLQGDGYNVLEAEDGTSALESAASYFGSIQLLVTDVIMPGMHGCDLAMRIRQHRPGLKVLYITGYADTDLSIDERTGVLEKPFTPDALLRKIREILDTKDKLDRAKAG